MLKFAKMPEGVVLETFFKWHIAFNAGLERIYKDVIENEGQDQKILWERVLKMTLLNYNPWTTNLVKGIICYEY